MNADSPDGEVKLDPLGEWEDISDNTPFEYHWHRNPDDGDYPSIRIFTSIYPGYPVEIYPDPREDEDGVWRTSHDTLEDAAERVLELMEEYPHDD